MSSLEIYFCYNIYDEKYQSQLYSAKTTANAIRYLKATHKLRNSEASDSDSEPESNQTRVDNIFTNPSSSYKRQKTTIPKGLFKRFKNILLI